jgi:hypothetical protein
MPGFLYHVGAAAICPHGGQVAVVPSSPRVLVSGSPVATMADQHLIAACAFNLAGAPHPCLKVQWLVPAARVLVNGQPVLLLASTGLCLAADQAPQGPPTITTTQTRVAGI